MERSASTKSEKPRTGWSPVVLKTGSYYEIHILWKDARNNLKLYCQTKEKRVFGRIVAADISNRKNAKGDEHSYYVIKNEYGLEICFRTSMFCPALLGNSNFCKKLIELRCQADGDIKISRYITRLIISRGFSHFVDGIDATTVKVSEDEELEFKSFYDTACEGATLVTVGGIEEAIRTLAATTNRGKRQGSDGRKPQSKQSKIEKFFSKELRDENGVEKQHVEGFHARADVHIDCLDISKDVLLPTDDLKVKTLAKEMLERFDPSLITLTVVQDQSEEGQAKESPQFRVVHGRHRLLALKFLRSQDRLKNLPMMQNETVTCYILGLKTVPGVNYASLRGNELGARFVSKPNHHDVTKMLAGLLESLGNQEEVTEIIVRYINILKFSEVLKIAIRNICKWSLECMKILCKILSQYERYQTLDTDIKTLQRCNKKLMTGNKLDMPSGLFKDVARFSQQFLKDNSMSIFEKEKSVKTVVKEFLLSEERKKKIAKIEESAGFKSIDKLRDNYPEKFTDEILNKLPPVRPQSEGSSVENYTKTVIKAANKTDASQEIKYFEVDQDIQEFQRLLKYARRENVKAELKRSIQAFQEFKDSVRPEVDVYKFDPSNSNNTD